MTTSSAADPFIEQFKTKIQRREARVGIIGLGYVGLPLALLYSEQKFRITGFDIDSRKVETLANGGSYIYRILPEEIQAAKASGFSATSDYARISDMDAIIICVPTPLNEYHEPDLSFITDTTHSIAPHLRAGQLVVLESTTYPGTTEEVMIPILEKENKNDLKAARKDALTGKEFFVAFFSRAGGSRQHVRGAPGYSQGCRRIERTGVRIGGGPLRLDFQPDGSGLVSSGRRDDQVAGEYLSVREYRAGE